MDILVNVANQKLRIATNLKNLISGTQEFVKFVFNLNGDWDNLMTFAQFTQNGKSYNQYLDDENSVYLPSEIGVGTCTLMLYGSNDKTIATTNYLTLDIDDNILVKDANSTEISQSLYTQLVTKINSMSNWNSQSVADLEAVDADLQKQINIKANQIDLTTEISRAKAAEKVNADAITLKASQKDVDNLTLKVTELESNEVVEKLIKEAVVNEMNEYLANGSLASMTITDGSIARSKVDTNFEGTLAKADTAMQPSVYDPQNLKVDIFSYAQGRADIVKKDLDSVYNAFNKSNLIEEINTKQTGYFTSTNTDNVGSFANKTYTLQTSSDNMVRSNWVFNSDVDITKGHYYIGFDYVTTNDFNVGVKIDGEYKDLGKISAVADGEKHSFVAEANVTTSLNFYEVYLPNVANINCQISNIFVMSEFDFTKSYNSIQDFLTKHNLYEITPEQFGAVGNGRFDDTVALQDAIDYCISNGKQLKCQNGKTYCISNSLNLSNTSTCLIDFNWATLKAIKTMDYMITFDGSANAKNDVKTLLRNIIIDCNNKAGGLNLIYSYKFTFENFMIKNCQTVAIWIQRGGAFICQNGTIIGDCTPDSRGIYNQTSDCHFNEIVIVDMKKCIYNGGTNFYNKVHGWLTSKVANSIFFTHFAGFGSLTQCQCDTYETGYLLRTSYDLSLVACTYYNNYHLYDSEVTPVVFKFNSGIHPYARRICCTNCSFNSPNLQTTLSSVVDAQITFNGYTHFININGYSTISRISPTLQAKVTSGFDGSVNKLTYRNGLCYYDFSLQFTSTIGASNLLEIATIQSPYYPLENQMFPCYLTKTLAGSDCIVGKLLIGTDGKVQVRVPSGSVADYQYLYAHCYYEPKAIGE